MNPIPAPLKNRLRRVRVSAELLFQGLFGNYQREPEGGIYVNRIGIGPDMTPLPKDVRVVHMHPTWADHAEYAVVLASSEWDEVAPGAEIPEMMLHVESRVVKPDPDALAAVVADRMMVQIEAAKPEEGKIIMLKVSDDAFDLMRGNYDDLLLWYGDNRPGFLIIAHSDDAVTQITPSPGDLVTISTGADLTEVDVARGQKMFEEKFPGVRFMVLPAGAEVKNQGPISRMAYMEMVNAMKSDALARVVADKISEKFSGVRVWFEDGPVEAPEWPDPVEGATGGFRMPDITLEEIQAAFDANGGVIRWPNKPEPALGSPEWTAAEIAALKKEFQARHGGEDHGPIVVTTQGFVPVAPEHYSTDPKASPYVELADRIKDKADSFDGLGKWKTFGPGEQPTLNGFPIYFVDHLPANDRAVEVAAGMVTRNEARILAGRPPLHGTSGIDDTIALVPCPFCKGKRDAQGKCIGCNRTSRLEGDPTNPDDPASTT
jgi:hypothetical protein